MKILKKRVNVITILVSLTILISCLSFRNGDDRQSVILKLIIDELKKQHYEARPIDDEFSKNTFKQFISSLDYSKHFFTLKDVKKLKKYEYEIDNQIKNVDFTFYNVAKQIIAERIVESEKLYKEILSSPFDFSKDDFYETDAEKGDYPKNNKEWRESWRLLLKYQVLSRVHTAINIQNQKKEDNDTSYVEKAFKELEEEARKKVLKSNDAWFKRLEQLTDKDRFSQYINAITETYDPHTTYYPPKDKANFDIQMSGRLEGIGATLQQKDGYTKVTQIVPGSASWRQGDLKEEDIILKVAQGDKEPVDIVGMRLDDAVQLIRGKKGTEVRLTVKKIDGTIAIISITRDIVVIEKTYAKSNVILQDNKKYGYIKLPKFYADFNGTGGRSCSEDVEKELEKLKEEGIEGVILDLRNNGGGALNEVVDMTGLFIKEGPIVQVKTKFGNPYVLKDQNDDVTYGGPLVILVNSFSASASEILAAAVQDYGRGVIIGSSNTTHGKGTVQRVIDLDRSIRGNQSIKPLGAMKLTTQKFYRINGGATQLKGVTPDIIIPDRYSYLDLGEKELEFALKWDKIKPSYYNEIIGAVNNLSALKTLSSSRVQSDTIFQKYDEYAKRLKKQSEVTSYSLNFEKFKIEQKKNKEYTDQYNELKKSITEMPVFSTQTDRMVISNDSTKKVAFEVFNKQVSKDHYLVEAIKVLNDIDRKD